MNRTRTAVVAAAAGLAAVLAVPGGAHAAPTCANAWLVQRDGTREYLPEIGPDGVCHETGWDVLYDGGAEPSTTWVPGPYIGAGVEVWITSPV